MDHSFFRKKSVERFSSPEELNDYLHVTTPLVWVVLAAVILLLAGLFVWSATTAVESFAAGTAQVEQGVLTVTFDDEEKAKNVEIGMNVMVGDLAAPILSVGHTEDGGVVAVAKASLPDGSYDAKVGYKTTQIIKLFLN